jgi:cob(I)alamin adenosyltransferase
MKIYTKTGDSGETGLIGGERLAKHDSLIEVIGDIDELNASVGILISIQNDQYRKNLYNVQHTLFVIGARLASLRTSAIPPLELKNTATFSLEQWIDEMTSLLPPLTQFILPGGHQAAAQAFLVRAVCRRAERHLSPLLHEKNGYLDSSFEYINRLSDALFTYARFVNFDSKTTEMPWIK